MVGAFFCRTSRGTVTEFCLVLKFFYVGTILAMTRVVFFLLLFFLPVLLFAQVIITEVMYDPEGADANAGGEWIEVRNAGSVAVNLTQWKFFENNVNHGIVADATPDVPSGGYAVIAEDISIFKNYFTNFSGLLFRASFSLNDSEALAMKENKDALPSDSVTYTSEWGAENDGNSLQKISSGWSAAAPTPGSENASNGAVENGGSSSSEAEEAENNNADNQSAEGQNSPASSGNEAIDVHTQIKVLVKERPRIVGVGVSFSLKGFVLGLDDEPIDNARYMWSLGDGARREGQNIAYTYQYPGEYVVILDGSSGQYADSVRFTVKVVPIQIIVANVGPKEDFYIELKNESQYEVDLGNWILISGSRNFRIPEKTFIISNKTLIFPPHVTSLSYADGTVALYYPDGKVSSMYIRGSLDISAAQTVALPMKQEVAPQKANIPETASEEKTEVAPYDAEIEDDMVTASVEPILNQSNSTFSLWFIGTLGLIGIALFGFLFMRRSTAPPLEPEEILAEEMEITEVKETKKD